MGETVGETVDRIKEETYHVKEAAEERAQYAKDTVSSQLGALKDSFLQFKADYDHFKEEAIQGHGPSLFDKAATAVSDLTAWLTGELEDEEDEGEEGDYSDEYQEGSGQGGIVSSSTGQYDQKNY